MTSASVLAPLPPPAPLRIVRRRNVVFMFLTIAILAGLVIAATLRSGSDAPGTAGVVGGTGVATGAAVANPARTATASPAAPVVGPAAGTSTSTTPVTGTSASATPAAAGGTGSVPAQNGSSSAVVPAPGALVPGASLPACDLSPKVPTMAMPPTVRSGAAMQISSSTRNDGPSCIGSGDGPRLSVTNAAGRVVLDLAGGAVSATWAHGVTRSNTWTWTGQCAGVPCAAGTYRAQATWAKGSWYYQTFVVSDTCTALTLTIAADSAPYVDGRPVQVVATIANTSGESCVLDARTVTLQITGPGGAAVTVFADTQQLGPTGLAAGGSATVAFRPWNHTGSATGLYAVAVSATGFSGRATAGANLI